MERHTPHAEHWSVSKAKADEVLPAARKWLGGIFEVEPTLIREATQTQDETQNTDLIIPGFGGVAWRVRWVNSEKTGENYFEFWWREFSVRAKRARRNTEKQKTVEGLGDWFFYCWAHNDTKQILCALLIDLSRLKDCIEDLPKVPALNRNSMGGTDSGLHVYSIKHVAERGCVVDFKFAEESGIVAPGALPASPWERRQLVRFVEAHRAPLHLGRA